MSKKEDLGVIGVSDFLIDEHRISVELINDLLFLYHNPDEDTRCCEIGSEGKEKRDIGGHGVSAPLPFAGCKGSQDGEKQRNAIDGELCTDNLVRCRHSKISCCVLEVMVTRQLGSSRLYTFLTL